MRESFFRPSSRELRVRGRGDRLSRAIKRVPALERSLLAATFVAPILCLALAPVVFYWLHSWPAARFVALYVAPMALVTPWWIRERLHASRSRTIRPTAMALDVAVLLLALARFGIGDVLPFSGHMLFLIYSALTPPVRRYRWVAAALIVETTIFKLWIWQDVHSWTVGLAAGVVAAMIWRRIARVG